jgi:hypothetical protein
MPTRYPSGRVFILYPDAGNVGHASLYIGNHEVGKKFELSLDRMNTEHYKANTLVELRRGRDFGNVHYNDNYVSSWPEGNAGPFDRAMLAACATNRTLTTNWCGRTAQTSCCAC